MCIVQSADSCFSRAGAQAQPSRHGLQDTEEGAKTYNNLGLVHSLRSDFAVSAKMFEAAGRIREKTGTLKMPMNARRLYNFGSMRLKQGRIAREELQEKAVSAEDVSQTATEDSQFFTQAAELLQKAVDILEKYDSWRIFTVNVCYVNV